MYSVVVDVTGSQQTQVSTPVSQAVWRGTAVFVDVVTVVLCVEVTVTVHVVVVVTTAVGVTWVCVLV